MICRVNQLTGFYMMTTLAFNEVIFAEFVFEKSAKKLSQNIANILIHKKTLRKMFVEFNITLNFKQRRVLVSQGKIFCTLVFVGVKVIIVN